MKFLKFFSLCLVLILLCGCDNNEITKNNNDDLSKNILSNAEKIDELEKQLSSLKLDVDTLNNEFDNKINDKDNYAELKDKYNKISSENKDLKNKISNLNSLIDNINKQNTSDIVYITFVAKGLIRISQITGNNYVYEGSIYNFPINKNYTLGEQLPYFYKNTGPRDNYCNRVCWLKDINDTECINVQEFKVETNTVLYSICLNDSLNNSNNQ